MLRKWFPRSIPYPLWHASVKEALLRKPNGSREAKQTTRDLETDNSVLEILGKGGKVSVAEMRSKTGWQQDRLQRSVNRLEKDGKIHGRRMKSKATGKTTERYSLAVVCSDDCSPKSESDMRLLQFGHGGEPWRTRPPGRRRRGPGRFNSATAVNRGEPDDCITVYNTAAASIRPRR